MPFMNFVSGQAGVFYCNAMKRNRLKIMKELDCSSNSA